MEHQTAFHFLDGILEKMHIQAQRLFPGTPLPDTLDLGIRRLLGRHSEYQTLFSSLPVRTAGNTLYKHVDPYLCNYLYLKLADDTPSILLIGPYLNARLSRTQLLQEAERHGVPPRMVDELEYYYGRLAVLEDESLLLSVINTFCETLWGGSEAYEVVNQKEEESGTTEITPNTDAYAESNSLLTMEHVAQRYAFENELIRTVSLGLTHKALLMLSSIHELALKQRVADPLRNTKNYCIIMNTLMRKAAEQGAVHPYYLDLVSSDFAGRIELTGTVTAGHSLMKDMAATYCRLVSKHAVSTHSLPIRNTMLYIDANPAADLSLHALAALVNLSGGYLSTLFHKEVGETVTDHVHKRRMLLARQLLGTTSLQIHTIAQHCGFADVNYFSRTFKHHCGCTPKAYRRTNPQQIRAHPQQAH